MNAILLQTWWIFLIPAVLVWVLGFPLIRELTRRQVLDRPNERSSHSVTTPRGGGIAISIILLVGLGVIGLWRGGTLPFVLLACALVLAAVSFLDDVKELPARIRFTVQVAAALFFGFAAVAPAPGGTHSIPVLLLSFLLLCLVGYTNAFNFMDGINGLAAGQAVVTGFGTAMIAFFVEGSPTHSNVLCAILLSGAAFGFLPHNFPRASVFMGDVGSVPLGFLLGALTIPLILKAGPQLLIPFALLHANFLLDTSITLARRALRGDKIYTPHKEHFYQRLVRAGFSHSVVTGMEMFLQGVTVLLIFSHLVFGVPGQSVLVLAVVGYWLLLFVFAEILFRRASRRENSASPAPAPSV